MNTIDLQDLALDGIDLRGRRDRQRDTLGIGPDGSSCKRYFCFGFGR